MRDTRGLPYFEGAPGRQLHQVLSCVLAPCTTYIIYSISKTVKLAVPSFVYIADQAARTSSAAATGYAFARCLNRFKSAASPPLPCWPAAERAQGSENRGSKRYQVHATPRDKASVQCPRRLVEAAGIYWSPAFDPHQSVSSDRLLEGRVWCS